LLSVKNPGLRYAATAAVCLLIGIFIL